MKKARPLLHWAGIVMTVFVVSICGLEAHGVSVVPEDTAGKRSDLIIIDMMEKYGKLEEGAVAFFHDQHVESVERYGKDCFVCHKKENDGSMSIKFNRVKDGAKDDVLATYHDNCIGCHKEVASKGDKTGPGAAECRTCHVGSAADSMGEMKPFKMDKSLHFAHMKAEAARLGVKEAETCKECHHEYDKIARKLVYKKDKEDNCRACHGEVATEEASSIREASHESCVACHYTLKVEKEKAGPVNCAGCHSTVGQKKVKEIKDVPRLERGQPDAILINAGDLTKDGVVIDLAAGKMSPVPFNHKNHEGAVDSCRTCHHTKIESCSAKCHTVRGNKDGGYVQLSQAMHQKDAMQSCVGCHEKETQKPECAGCHSLMNERPANDASCVKCHATGIVGATDGRLELTDKQGEQIASNMLAVRDTRVKVFDLKDIPETVKVGYIVDQYEASEFPHRKIVAKLVEGVSGNKLANVFHGEKGTLCQGCHHNSPASLTPPKCVTCHGKPFNVQELGRPGLKAAFHLQCIGCHTEMGLEKPAATACVECHKKRN